LTFYGATFVNKIDGVSEIRKKGDDGKWEGWNWFVKYYAMIPVSYFVMVGIIIVIAYGLDISKEMGNGEFFKYGMFAAIAKSLIAIFSISMSVVLSGFSAIPLGLFALLWIVFPEGAGVPMWSKWSNAIRDNYWIPEFNVCEENWYKKWSLFIISKLWNNKILISMFIVINIVINLHYGKGDVVYGREEFNSINKWSWNDFGAWSLTTIIPISFISLMLSQETIRDKSLSAYISEPINTLIALFKSSQSVENSD